MKELINEYGLSLYEIESRVRADITKMHKWINSQETFAFDGMLCKHYIYIHPCSGCFEGGDYMGLAHNYHILTFDEGRVHVGTGCDECRHLGVIVDTFVAPLKYENIE